MMADALERVARELEEMAQSDARRGAMPGRDAHGVGYFKGLHDAGVIAAKLLRKHAAGERVRHAVTCEAAAEARKTLRGLDEAVSALIDFVRSSEALARATGNHARAEAFADVLQFTVNRASCAHNPNDVGASCAVTKAP